jgi:hypothetical protein
MTVRRLDHDPRTTAEKLDDEQVRFLAEMSHKLGLPLEDLLADRQQALDYCAAIDRGEAVPPPPWEPLTELPVVDAVIETDGTVTQVRR